MAFVLTPRFAPAYQAQQCNPFGLCGPASRPQYAYRVARPRPQRPQYSSFGHFFNQVDELLSEIDREAQRQAHIAAIEAQREAQRQAHRQRQQRKRALRANFAVNQTEQGWQVDGEIQGFDQENISIEVTDEHTLRIAGNTQWQAEKTVTAEKQVAVEGLPAEAQQPIHESPEDKTQVGEPDFDEVSAAVSATARPSSPDSDTQSHKSYQATVEDDFEDLGAETSSLTSSPSRPSSPVEKEPKGKEKAVEESAVVAQPQSAEPVPQQAEPKQEERVHGSFERTFRFPDRIDGASISASFKDGALKVIVPRAPIQQVRRIAIS